MNGARCTHTFRCVYASRARSASVQCTAHIGVCSSVSAGVTEPGGVLGSVLDMFSFAAPFSPAVRTFRFQGSAVPFPSQRYCQMLWFLTSFVAFQLQLLQLRILHQRGIEDSLQQYCRISPMAAISSMLSMMHAFSCLADYPADTTKQDKQPETKQREMQHSLTRKEDEGVLARPWTAYRRSVWGCTAKVAAWAQRVEYKNQRVEPKQVHTKRRFSCRCLAL